MDETEGAAGKPGKPDKEPTPETGFMREAGDTVVDDPARLRLALVIAGELVGDGFAIIEA